MIIMILSGLIIVIPYSEFLEGGRKFTHRALIFQSKDMAVLCLPTTSVLCLSQYVVIYLIETIGVSKTDISTHLGVTAKGNRTLNNWLGNSGAENSLYRMAQIIVVSWIVYRSHGVIRASGRVTC
ncbi:hypothetical protein CTM76_19260 [Photobacterium phosphoreum]|nr:hypothetical protein AYY25_08370 [Photobacterium phosphoreum]PSU75357.1 hypothetical protein CTM76_19260 [Photobacterium phosphoreum]